MRLLLLFAAVGACGTSSPDPHELGTCTGYTVNGMPATNQVACELPCEMAGSNGAAPQGTGSACATATNPNVAPAFRMSNCTSTLEWDGVAGCCIGGEKSPGEFETYFYECQ